MEVSPSAPNPGAPASTAPTPEEAAANEPMFASFHTLLKRVSDRSELPTDHVWIRDKDRVLQELDIRTIPEARLSAFHAAVAAGRVYAFWGHRFVEFDDLDSNWPNKEKKPVAQAATQGTLL